MPPKAFWPVLGTLLILAAVVLLPGIFPSRHTPVERPPSTALKTIASAQADFRANDRDGDGRNQFWRADIAGLYALAPGGGPAIRLIERSLALADARPVYDLTRDGERAPKQGYWYRAIRPADEKTIDAASQFAAVA